jgi:malonyl-CoA decarboxylase
MPPRRFRDRLLRRGARRKPGKIALDVAPGLPERDAARVRDVVTDLLRLHDTMTQRVEAAVVADAYLSLSDEGRRNFLVMLARDFWSDPKRVDDAMKELRLADERRSAERRLRDALSPPALQLIRLFTGLEGGVKFLVDLRADLLRLSAGDPDLTDLDRELKGHLVALFDVGILTLRRMTWDAPAAILEKLIEYEAVHAIGSWDELKHRLDSDRRC